MDGSGGEHGKQFVAWPGHCARGLHVLRVKPLPPSVGAGALLQQGQGGDVLGADLGGSGQQGGAAHGQHGFVHQQPGAGAGPLLDLRRGAGVQGGVKAADGAEQKGAGAGFDVDLQLGVQPRQRGQARNQPARGKGGDGCQRHRAAVALAAAHVQGVALQRVQPLRHQPGVVGPGGGQHHAVLAAPEQGRAHKFFQRSNLARDGPLRQRQFVGGAGVALVAGGGVKAGQGLHGGQFAAHGDFGWRGGDVQNEAGQGQIVGLRRVRSEYGS